jgi:acetoin utilization deacetylase AcuC-like enzyme
MGHPESSKRLADLEILFELGGPFAYLPHLEFQTATLEDLGRVHGKSHIQAIAKTKGQKHCQIDPDTSTSAQSYETALLACGATKRIIDVVMAGEVKCAFALPRPPGHHAESSRAMGFCLFNNIAVGAAYGREKYNLKKIMIVDWDVHHGNGTQEIFWQDPSVLYCSTHQYPLFPGTGHFSERGQGEGLGFTVNIPMPAGLGDGDFQEIFERVVLPLARVYQPELILISAGYDAFIHDPIGGQAVTQRGFGRLTRLMMDVAGEVCEGRLALVLEGGYNLVGLKDCVATTLRVLQEEESAPKILEKPHAVTGQIIENVKKAHNEQWVI